MWSFMQQAKCAEYVHLNVFVQVESLISEHYEDYMSYSKRL